MSGQKLVAAISARPEFQENSRLSTLDALRGIAAIVVVFHHILATLPAMWAIYEYQPASGLRWFLGYTPMHLLWAGPEAVIIFFVLSGFVLSESFWKGTALPWRRFALKRIIRLYPPYILAVFLGGLLMTWLSRWHLSGMSVWFNGPWSIPISWPMVIDHVTMLASDRYNTIDGPIWTLAIEMYASLLFPGIVWLISRMGLWAIPLGVAVAVAGRFGQLPGIFHYLWLFIIGSEINRHSSVIRARLQRMSTTLQLLGTAAALTLLISRWLMVGSLPMYLTSLVAPFLIGIGAAWLVTFSAFGSALAPFLSCRPIQWLGRISYSLYLTHFIILFSLIYGLNNTTPLWVILFIATPICLIVAELFFIIVEQPSIHLSRMMGNKYRKPSGFRAQDDLNRATQDQSRDTHKIS